MHTDEGGNITLLDSFKCQENTVGSLISTIYPSISNPNLSNPGQYFLESTILSTLNTEVDCLNAEVLSKFSREVQVFHSADSILTSEQSGQEDIMLNYPVEYLNSINCSGLPLSKLELKEGCPIMVLRNVNVAYGVCNGSRGIVTRLRSRVVEVKLLSEDFAGQKVFIPRISNQPTEDQIAFKFNRRQFPIRLGFAMTFNKSQGQSVQHVRLDLRRPVFSHGQFYIGVSRVTSVSNIKVI
jgi:ATP-dependent DNA helicase PIF1